MHGYNNPVNTIDPSGHKACETEDCRNMNRRDLLIRELSELFNWSVDNGFNTAAIGVIYSTANDIRGYVDNLTKGNGLQWMNTFIGSAIFTSDNKNTRLLKAGGFVFPDNLVHLADGFTGNTVAHEIAHVLDNHIASQSNDNLLTRFGLFNDATFIGGGPADAMVSAVGGNPGICVPRFFCGKIIGTENYRNVIAGYQPWSQNIENGYGNSGTAEDFAMVFEYALYSPNNVPLIRLKWMEAFISVSGIN